jgi:hypothetical protein
MAAVPHVDTSSLTYALHPNQMMSLRTAANIFPTQMILKMKMKMRFWIWMVSLRPTPMNFR